MLYYLDRRRYRIKRRYHTHDSVLILIEICRVYQSVSVCARVIDRLRNRFVCRLCEQCLRRIDISLIRGIRSGARIDPGSVLLDAYIHVVSLGDFLHLRYKGFVVSAVVFGSDNGSCIFRFFYLHILIVIIEEKHLQEPHDREDYSRKKQEIYPYTEFYASEIKSQLHLIYASILRICNPRP